MPRAEYAWDAESRADLRDLREDGMSVKAIARMMGKDPIQVQNKLTRMGWTRQRKAK